MHEERSKQGNILSYDSNCTDKEIYRKNTGRENKSHEHAVVNVVQYEQFFRPTGSKDTFMLLAKNNRQVKY
jgi:hypothetical protein